MNRSFTREQLVLLARIVGNHVIGADALVDGLFDAICAGDLALEGQPPLRPWDHRAPRDEPAIRERPLIRVGQRVALVEVHPWKSGEYAGVGVVTGITTETSPYIVMFGESMLLRVHRAELEIAYP